jgi:tRNA(fMet)-specific endonuclease VapC
MKYLLDTNMCIYIINRRPLEVIQKFKQCAPGQIGISAVTLSELRYGISKSTRREKNETRLEEFLLPFEVLPYDADAATVYGDIRFQLEKSGHPIGSLDLLIAAHAISADLTLITNNEKEFRRVHRLRVENWAL